MVKKCSKSQILTLFLFTFFFKCATVIAETEKSLIDDAVKTWAPLIWLAPKEKYFPLDIEEFLQFVYPADVEGRAVADTLPLGKKSQDLYLVTKDNLEFLKKNKSFLHGKNPTNHSIPIYITVTECQSPNENEIHHFQNILGYNKTLFYATYWAFYPYNEGKEICLLGRFPTPFLFNTCLGEVRTFGDHVGDFEHLTIAFGKNYEPFELFLSVHDIGVYYRYEPNLKIFKFNRQIVRKGIIPRVKFPSIVRMFENRPLLFAAKGSHGLWSASGAYQYTTVPRLYDKNGHGTPWQTWKNLNIYHLGYSKPPLWVKYLGRWGNPKNNCLISKTFGICELADAPFGILNRKPDFYC